MKGMGFLKDVKTAARHWYHHREIEASVKHYRRRTGLDAEKSQVYSESGSFRSQLDRLFSLGNAAETSQLVDAASRVVTLCLSNKFYRPADLLSDMIDALESRTFLSGEPEGEPPIQELEEHLRKLKLKRTIDAYLVPLKVASIENLITAHATMFRRRLPFASLGRFERQTAKLCSLIEQSELRLVEEEVSAFLRRWIDVPGLQERYKEPAEALGEVARHLDGETLPGDIEGIRTRRPGQPVRLSTVVPEDRQHLLRAALKKLG